MIASVAAGLIAAAPAAAGIDWPGVAGEGHDIVFVGEVHDNPDHHAEQAAAVRAIAPRALVFEMIGPKAAERVTPALLPDAGSLDAVLEWTASGWPDFAMYHPIFLAAPSARVYGAAVPRAGLRHAAEAGAAAAYGEGAADFALDTALAPDDLTTRKDEMAAAHCGALPEDALAAMVEVQRLRDAVIARAALRALTETGGPVVVIAGNGHVRTDHGAPAMIARAAPEVRVLAVGQGEGMASGGEPFDLWSVSPAPERGDPCAVFTQPD